MKRFRIRIGHSLRLGQSSHLDSSRLSPVIAIGPPGGESPPGPPDPPTDLTLSTAGGVFDLAWTDDSMDETGFRIEFSYDNATWIVHSTVPADTTSDSVPTAPYPGPIANTTVYWRVIAVGSGGDSPPSNVVSGSVADAERIDVDKLVPTLVAEEANPQGADVDKLLLTAVLDEANGSGADVDKLVPTLIADETRVEAADVDRLLLTVIVDETYP